MAYVSELLISDIMSDPLNVYSILFSVLPPLGNIRTEFQQSIGYTGSKDRLRKDLLHMNFSYTRCGLNRKVLMERQDVVLSSIRYLRKIKELREAGYTLVYIQMKLTFIPTMPSGNAGKTTLLC